MFEFEAFLLRTLKDSIDLFLGSHVVDRWEGVAIPSPLHAEAVWRPYVVSYIILSVFIWCAQFLM